MIRKLLEHGRRNAVAYIAVVAVLGLAPTSAYATAALVVRSSNIVDGEVKNPDLAANGITSGKIRNGQVTGSDLATDSVDTAKVKNNTLAGWDILDNTIGGDDVLESSLGQVPTALQGGLGRYGFTGSCDPESTTFVTCSHVQVTLDRPGRVLVVGTVRASDEGVSDSFAGQCRVGTSAGPVAASTDTVEGFDDEGGNNPDGEFVNLTVMAVTNVFPAGTHSFGVDCNQATTGAIEYVQARVTAVALSAG